MKPMTEWTTDELVEWLDIDAGNHRRAALAELLRRERERCAKECDEYAKWEEGGRLLAALACAKRIRGLQ